MSLVNKATLNHHFRAIPKSFIMYHKLHKTFSRFYHGYYDLISKINIVLKSLLHQRLSEPEFYGDLVYKLKEIVGSNNFLRSLLK